MKQIPCYERAPYLTELEVEVVEVRQEEGRLFALLDDTILYPEGGGQPSDFGWLNGVRIDDVRKRGAEIRHYLTGGEVIAGKGLLLLDWPRRFDHMQQHTAQHLLSALAVDLFGWRTRAFHLGLEVSDIDLDAAAPAEEEISALEEAVAVQIQAARRIQTRRVDPEDYRSLEVRSRGLPAGHCGDVRLVEIEGVDLNTCGGTHVAMTSEVGGVKIIRAEAHRGGTRLFWVAGGRLRRRLGRHEARSGELRGLLDTGDDELVSVCRLKLDQLAAERRQRRLLEEELVQRIVQELEASPGAFLHRQFVGVEEHLLRRVSEELGRWPGERVAFLTCDRDGGALFSLVQGGDGRRDLRALGSRVCEILGGRGGGSESVFQGKADSLSRRDEVIGLIETEMRQDA